MSTPNPDDRDRFTTEADQSTSSRSTIASILWIVLLLALIGLGIWWFTQRADVQVPPTPPAIQEPLVVDPVPARTAPNGSAPPAAAASPDPTADKPAVPARRAPPPKPPVASNRDPLPLPSNRIPVYPAQALRSGVEGSVSVLIDVDASGVPTGVRVVRRSGERSRDLDRAVLTAARNWRFDPAIRNGQPAPGRVVLPVQFKRD